MIRSQASGDYDPSIVTEALKEIQYSDTPNQDINLLKDVAVQAYLGQSAKFTSLFSPLLVNERSNTSAGTDTTVSAIGTFFLAMVCYPEVQKAAQAELDNVLNGRLPEHSDIFSLPYLSALVKEIYRYAATCSFLSNHAKPVSVLSRWEPVGPLGRPLFLSNMFVTS